MNKDKKLNNKDLDQITGGYILDYTSNAGIGCCFIYDDKGYFASAAAKTLEEAEKICNAKGFSNMVISTNELYDLRDKGYFIRDNVKYCASWNKSSTTNKEQ